LYSIKDEGFKLLLQNLALEIPKKKEEMKSEMFDMQFLKEKMRANCEDQEEVPPVFTFGSYAGISMLTLTTSATGLYLQPSADL
jgi:hypothetical protein